MTDLGLQVAALAAHNAHPQACAHTAMFASCTPSFVCVEELQCECVLNILLMLQARETQDACLMVRAATHIKNIGQQHASLERGRHLRVVLGKVRQCSLGEKEESVRAGSVQWRGCG